jgi:hypothetical protein
LSARTSTFFTALIKSLEVCPLATAVDALKLVPPGEATEMSSFQTESNIEPVPDHALADLPATEAGVVGRRGEILAAPPFERGGATVSLLALFLFGQLAGSEVQVDELAVRADVEDRPNRADDSSPRTDEANRVRGPG